MYYLLIIILLEYVSIPFDCGLKCVLSLNYLIIVVVIFIFFSDRDLNYYCIICIEDCASRRPVCLMYW